MAKFSDRSRIVVTLLALWGLALPLNACENTANDDAPIVAPVAYLGPGSIWRLSFSGTDRYTLTEHPDAASSPVLTVSGSYVRLSTGFSRLTVAEANGPGAPPIDARTWGLEVPDYTLVLHPLTGDQPIPMIRDGRCPSLGSRANWVLFKKRAADRADDSEHAFFGTFQHFIGDSRADFPVRRALANTFQNRASVSLNTTAAACLDGRLPIESADTEIFLSANGGAIVHTEISDPDNRRILFGLTPKAILNVSAFDGSYAGMIIDESRPAGERIRPVLLNCTAGNCSGAVVTDLETGSLGTAAPTLELSGTPDAIAEGFITGVARTDSTDARPLACLADFDAYATGHKIFTCVGQSPADPAKMFNAVLVSQ